MIWSKIPVKERIDFFLSVRHNIDIESNIQNIHVVIGVWGEIHVFYYSAQESQVIMLNEGLKK